MLSVALLLAMLALSALVTGCGGGGDDDEGEMPVSPPFASARDAEKAFQLKALDVFSSGSTAAAGLEWSRDSTIPIDHLVVRLDGQLIYESRGWFIYAFRGQMRDGTDVVLVQGYDSYDDPGYAALFVAGKHVELPDLRVEQREGHNRPATLRNVRELGGSWLLGWATYQLLDRPAPAHYAWVLVHAATGTVYNLGEWCGACTLQ